MVTVGIKYGKDMEQVNIPKENLMCLLKGNFKNTAVDDDYERQSIEDALKNPIGCKKLSQIAKKGQKVVIMVSDITRPCPSYRFIMPVLHELERAGVNREDIRIVFGMGIHRHHSEEEHIRLIGKEAHERVRCTDSSEEEYINIGRTSRGTPVNVCRSVAEADIRICTGNIEYHYFAGYSGGAKAIMPGACNYESIKHNHSLQLLEGARSGQIEGNPVREDIDEIGRMLDISFILNVVLNDEKKILKAFGGDYIAAHREGCKYLDSLYSAEVPQLSDIVLVSAGGYPKDINLYQAQKALDNGCQAVKNGGIIILAAKCQEGFGEMVFKQWIEEADSANGLIDRLKREFVLGGHKAAAIARVMKKARVYLVSSMDRSDAEGAFFIVKDSLQQALDHALGLMGKEAKVTVIPQGGSILPRLIPS